MTKLLEITGIRSLVNETEILKGIDLTIGKGEVHVIMGPNGAGKSTLANVIMGDPKYHVTDGTIIFDGNNITHNTVDERARKGIFLSFQTPMEIPGITLENFLRSAKTQITGEKIKPMAFKKEMAQKMKELDIDDRYGDRYLNDGYSGGEKKKNEILQMRMLNPKLAMLDETDSGLDVDAVRLVSKGIKDFRRKDNAIILITHHNSLLEYIEPDFVHVIVDGKIVDSGDLSLAREIEENGYIKYREKKEDKPREKKEISLF